ncbi:DUF262 domain-containing protein [Kineococcus sp. GCM10028916]|uniref:DUF262 domain-containing protein n=1 Tax=Kineococcus sp. GCM10028916 TaxID=3273394 RepID=UPI00363D0CE7
MTIDQPSLFRQPSATTFRMADLVRLVGGGQVRVPQFQRDFRWSGRDVVRLFDSVLRGFPVGSVLLWKRDVAAPETRIGALNVPAAPAREALWVVDGQQRVTSLVNAVSPEAYALDERFRLDYSLYHGAIVRHVENAPGLAVPLPTIFDLRRLLSWVQAHPGAADSVEELNDVNVRLREFELPASVVEERDEQVLREIFDRMNNAGKRLRRAEVFSALYSPREGESGEALTIGQVAEQIDANTTFGRIDDDTVLRALLARRGPNVTRDVNREFVRREGADDELPWGHESQQDAYQRGLDAMLAVTSFLQSQAGVPHFSFLPYRYLLVVLTRYFALFPDPHPRNLELLVRWFWRAALRGPQLFKGSTTGAMRQSCTMIHADDESGSVQRLLDSVERVEALPLPSTANFRTNVASTRVLLCALWERAPRALSTGAALTLDDLSSSLDDSETAAVLTLEIIPRRRVPADLTASSANRIIQPVDDVDAELVLAGNELLGWVETADVEMVLASHAVSSAASDALARQDVDGFLRLREEELTSLLTDFVTRRSGVDFDTTPPLAEFDLDDDVELRDDLLEPDRVAPSPAGGTVDPA